MNVPFSRIEVLSYFRDGGKIVGREICDSLDEAKAFARHQVSMFPYVEVAIVSGITNNWGDIIKRTDVLFRFQ